MATGNESKIDTKLFSSTADAVAASVKEIDRLCQEWSKAMTGLRGEWHPGTMVFGFLFGVAASWISARIPAAKAGKLEVTEALRFV